MSLLNNVFAHSLEPGDERAAARRREQPQAEDRGRSRLSVALIVGMVALGLLLSVAVLQAQGSANIVSAEREGLIERIRDQDAKTERLQETLSALQADIAELEDIQLQSSAAGQRVRENLQLLQGVTGTAAVAGQGVSVVLENAESSELTENPNLARVLDIDLQQVVNGLWAAGAEAISINGQRITSLSAIRMANDVILVNSRPISPPYHVQAIGDSRTLPNRFSAGPGGEILRTASSYGVRYAVRAEESITLPAANLSLNYASRAEAS